MVYYLNGPDAPVPLDQPRHYGVGPQDQAFPQERRDELRRDVVLGLHGACEAIAGIAGDAAAPRVDGHRYTTRVQPEAS